MNAGAPHGGHGGGHGGGGHHGGGGRRWRGGDGWWGGANVVYVTDIADCPAGYEAIVHPDGTVVCTRIASRGLAGTSYDEAAGHDRFAHLRHHTTIAGPAQMTDTGDLRWNGPPEPYGVGVNYTDAAGLGDRDYSEAGDVPPGPTGLLDSPIVVGVVAFVAGLLLAGSKGRR